jgi:hypothetical protein
MNVYVSKDIIQKWPQYEFVGHSFSIGEKKYIWAKHKNSDIFRNKHIYSFEDDWFWHEFDIQFLRKL